MASDSAFFWTVLILQGVFSPAVVLLVARRWPAKARIYRLAAPAALPIMLMLMVSWGYYQIQSQHGLQVQADVFGRFAVAYLVLWIIGVLMATTALRLLRR